MSHNLLKAKKYADDTLQELKDKVVKERGKKGLNINYKMT